MISVTHLYEKIFPDPSAIKIIEDSLDIKLPEQYKEFINKYGAIDSDDISIYGSWKNDPQLDMPSVIGYTKILRDSIHLSKEFISIHTEGLDEILLNINDGHIYKWYESLDKILPIVEIDSFNHFLRTKGVKI